MTAPKNPSRNTSHSSVVVVGMGPVGMVAALALASHGIDVTVLEAGHALATESRASTFHPPTLEILADLGLSEELHGRGLIAPRFQYRERSGKILADFDLSCLAQHTRFPYRLQSEQNNLTEIIAGRLQSMPNVRLVFDADVERVERTTSGGSVYVRGDQRVASYTGDWIIAADGASSRVRKSLGIAFEGVTYPERFVVASTTRELRDDIPNLALVSYISDPDDWGVLLKTPKHWRILMPVSEAVTDEEATTPGTIQARLQRLSPISGEYPLEHTTIYAVHQRVASTFHTGRILLTGDAAHANNPLGGMGMNSGIHDARAAADIILAHLGGADADRCAAAYTYARREAAVAHVQKYAQQNYDELQENDPAARHRRTADLELMSRNGKRTVAHLLQTTMITSLAASQQRLRTALRSAHADVNAPAGRRLSELLQNAPLHAPGCHDAVSARLAGKAGFSAAFLSGAAVSATVLGAPDLGYVGLGEMVEQIRRITFASDLPLIADADGGYGGPLHVARTIREYEAAGAGAAQIEDQALPKQCGHLDGITLLSIEDMCTKIRTAVGARKEMLIIARTDAMGVEGYTGAHERAVAYAEAGADMIFVERLHDLAQLAAIHRATEHPLVISHSEAAGRNFDHPTDEDLRASGIAVVLHPVSGLLAANAGVRGAFAAISSGQAQDPQLVPEWAKLTTLLDHAAPPRAKPDNTVQTALSPLGSHQ